MSETRWNRACIALSVVSLALCACPLARAAHSDLSWCGRKTGSANLVYPPMVVSFVGGTVPGLEMNKKSPWPWNRYQFKKDGCLAMGVDNMLFAFEQPDGTPVTAGLLQVLPCPRSGSAGQSLSREGAEFCGEIETQGKAGKSGVQDWYLMQIPYRDMNVLSRAQKLAADQQANTTVYVSAASGIFAGLLGFLGASGKNFATGLDIAGGIIVAGVVGYYFLVARPSRQENYIAVFAGEPMKGCGTPGGITADNIDKCSSVTFLRGDLATFKIKNSHDYYNLSMILSGKTGLEFISEEAMKGGGK